MSATLADHEQLVGILGALPDKFVVDFANGIDVSRDHIAMQRERHGMFDRLYDGFTGNGQRRQTEIHASLADGVAGSLSWLTELTSSLARSNFAITKVQQRVGMLQQALTDVGHHAGVTRDRLDRFERELKRRVGEYEQELARVDLVQRAGLHLDLVLSKWQSGVFGRLAPAGRCYAVLEELRWGTFGDFYRATPVARRTTHLDLLCHRAISQLAADLCVGASARVNTLDWLHADSMHAETNLSQGLAYLGDWAEAQRAPFVFTAATVPSELPSLLPRRCSAERMTRALIAEVFDGSEA